MYSINSDEIIILLLYTIKHSQACRYYKHKTQSVELD